MKYLGKTSVLLVGFVLGAGTLVYAAIWQGTGTVREGQIITAQVLKDNLDYLYERSWDFLGATTTVPTHRLSDISVAAPEYCDENGLNCFLPSDVVTIINNYSTTTVVTTGPRVMCEVTFDMRLRGTDTQKIRYLDEDPTGEGAIAIWSKHDKPDYNGRWTERIGAAYWGASLFDSSERAGAGYFDADDYHSQSAWLAANHSGSSGVMSYATFDMSTGGSASVTNRNEGTHSMSVSVGTCSEMSRPPVYAWNAGGWSGCAPTQVAYTIPADKGQQESTGYRWDYPATESRNITCKDNNGNTVSDAYCPLGGVPTESRSCCLTMDKGGQCLQWREPAPQPPQPTYPDP